MRWLAVLVVLAALLGGGVALLPRVPRQPPAATVMVTAAPGPPESVFARASRPRTFVFPRDHGPHPEYRTEWWYYTGNLVGPRGRRFGYQLTFFRIALDRASAPRASAWAARDVYMAHFAVTDVTGGRFHPHVRLARGAAGLAGARATPFRVWTDDWSVASDGAEALPMRLHAEGVDAAIDLVVDSRKPPVLQGERGLSRKGPEPGNASYYYSLTRLATRGSLRLDEERFEVQGLSWMDREWSTSALGDAVGWDWFALQLDDGREVMFYRLRRADGSTSPFSAGALVSADGTTRALGASDVRLDTLGTWTALDGVRYPARWHLVVVPAGLDLEVTPQLADQEYRNPVRYWEGAVQVSTSGRTPAGVGYVELVGYAAGTGESGGVGSD